MPNEQPSAWALERAPTLRRQIRAKFETEDPAWRAAISRYKLTEKQADDEVALALDAARHGGWAEVKLENGHNQPCVICKELTNSYAGNPSLWPVRLGNDGWRHIGCINRLLYERDATVASARRDALEEAWGRVKAVADAYPPSYVEQKAFAATLDAIRALASQEPTSERASNQPEPDTQAIIERAMAEAHLLGAVDVATDGGGSIPLYTLSEGRLRTILSAAVDEASADCLQPALAPPPEDPTGEMIARGQHVATASGAALSETQVHDIWQAMMDEWRDGQELKT